MDKFGKIGRHHWKERLKISKVTKFKSDLLQANKDTATQSRRFCVAPHHTNVRLQNSPYFWVFKYARAVKQKVWNEAENSERDWGETLKIFLLSQGVWGSRAWRA